MRWKFDFLLSLSAIGNYRQDIELLWKGLNSDAKTYVSKIIAKVFDGLTFEKNSSLFLTEFAATFADAQVLRRDYLTGLKITIDVDKLNKIESELNRIKSRYSIEHGKAKNKTLAPNAVR